MLPDLSFEAQIVVNEYDLPHARMTFRETILVSGGFGPFVGVHRFVAVWFTAVENDLVRLNPVFRNHFFVEFEPQSGSIRNFHCAVGCDLEVR